MKFLKIHKFPIDAYSIQLPEGAKPLDLQMQGRVVTLWALVDPQAQPVRRSVGVYATGNSIDSHTLEDWEYLGTVQDDGLVFHYWLEPEDV